MKPEVIGTYPGTEILEKGNDNCLQVFALIILFYGLTSSVLKNSNTSFSS